MDISITIGGAAMDVDGNTSLSLLWRSSLFSGDKLGQSRTMDLTLPATPGNRLSLGMADVPGFVDNRRWSPIVINAGGIIVEGRAVVTGCTVGGRYEVAAVLGGECELLDGMETVPVAGNLTTGRTITLRGKQPAVSGVIPPFSFYNYHNGVNTAGTADCPPTIYPSVNLGYLIDEAATAAGLKFRSLAAAELQPENFGLVLGSMKMDSGEEKEVRVSGSPRAGFNATVDGGGTLEDLGFTYGLRRYKKGLFGANVSVYCWTATRQVTLSFPAWSPGYPDSAAVVIGGTGRNFFGKKEPGHWAEGGEITLAAGEWFTVEAFGNWKMWGLGDYWKDYEDHCACSFRVKSYTDDYTEGGTVGLDGNLPDLSLMELAKGYCLMTDCVLVYNSARAQRVARKGELLAVPVGDVMGEAVAWRLEDYGVASDEGQALTWGIDGWGRRSVVECRSEDWVPEEKRYRRVYDIGDVAAASETVVGVIPWNDGSWVDGGGGRELLLSDVVSADNGGRDYKGVLTAFMRSGEGGQWARHLSTLSDLGVGDYTRALVGNPQRAQVRGRLPLHKFSTLHTGTTVMWRGLLWLVLEAAWHDGWCEYSLYLLN